MAPDRKRKAPDAMPVTTRRRSQRVSALGGKKSVYIEESSSEGEMTGLKRRKAAVEDEYDEKRGQVEDEDEETEEEEDDDDDENRQHIYKRQNGEVSIKKSPHGKSAAKGHVKIASAAAKDNSASSEDDSDIPAIHIVPVARMRDTNGIDYSDDRLHPNTLLFLADLKANNKRSWLKYNDSEYRRTLKDWESYITTLTPKLISSDSTIPELPFKDINFRIYRDIRFSKDPTPYKTHYGAAWSRTGRKGPYACYYLHCEPGGRSFVAGGIWHPEAIAVHRLRTSIDERPGRWTKVLMQAGFRRLFLEEARGRKKTKKTESEEARVKRAFAAQNQGNALKTKPKGFTAEHKDVELLKLRNFTVMKRIPDELYTRKGGQDEIAGYFRALVPFVTHLNRIVMPDPEEGEEEEDDDDDDDDDDES